MQLVGHVTWGICTAEEAFASAVPLFPVLHVAQEGGYVLPAVTCCMIQAYEGCMQLIGHVKPLCHGKMSLHFAGTSGTGICRTTDIALQNSPKQSCSHPV